MYGLHLRLAMYLVWGIGIIPCLCQRHHFNIEYGEAGASKAKPNLKLILVTEGGGKAPMILNTGERGATNAKQNLKLILLTEGGGKAPMILRFAYKCVRGGGVCVFNTIEICELMLSFQIRWARLVGLRTSNVCMHVAVVLIPHVHAMSKTGLAYMHIHVRTYAGPSAGSSLT